MARNTNTANNSGSISRRNFVKFGSAALVGSTLKLSPFDSITTRQDEAAMPKIKEYRILGRTGFKVSDIGMGTTRVRDANVIRYALDHGINYLDTAEGYGNGRAERLIGKVLKNFDRKKIFITSKIHFGANETEQSILNRFRNCLQRLRTDYIDAFYMHNVTDVNLLNHAAFHSATQKLKAEGRLRFIGLSSHGPKRGKGDSMEKVLLAAAEDGRFDLMLMVYNFMNKDVGNKVLAACKKNNVGTTAMKTAPGVLKIDDFDPENLTEEQQKSLQRMISQGRSRKQALERLKSRFQSKQESYEKTKPFVEKYNITTEQDLRRISIHWVAQNPDMHTTCVSFADFELVDRIVPISGTKLSRAEIDFLEQYKFAFNDQYCRHGCNACAEACPDHLPVSTIMRYAYYFASQGREKEAMQKYAALKDWNAAKCFGCQAPCLGSCPFGVDIQAQLSYAHSLLNWA